MRNLKKSIPVIALAAVLVLVCTGCGILNAAASILNKKPVTDTLAPGGSDIYVDNNAIPGDSSPDTQSADGTVQGDNTVPGTTASSVKNDGTTAKANSGTSTQSTTKSSGATKGTTAPATTGADLSNLSVKELQTMLFETKDPNVAGKILTICGFEYDSKQGIYYSSMNPLQRLAGFNIIYDIAAPRVGMIYSTVRIYFDYNGKNWMMQLWKGQYGITSGAEIGLYNKPENRVIPQYDCATDDELIMMQFDFYNQNKYVFSRGPEPHWWLTGFKVFNAGVSFLIDLDINLDFPSKEMALAFEKGLKNAQKTEIIDPLEFTRKGTSFNIKW